LPIWEFTLNIFLGTADNTTGDKYSATNAVDNSKHCCSNYDEDNNCSSNNN